MGRGIAHANRGKALEIAIDQANRQYLAHGIAAIQQLAVPTKVVPDRRRGEQKVVRSKSTVDFQGAWKGYPIAFDAKENQSGPFPLANVHEHQVDWLAAWEKHGGIGFLLIYQGDHQAVYLMPYKRLTSYWELRGVRGFSTIPADVITSLPKVRPGRGCTLDYLAALEEWLRTKTTG